MVPSFSRIVPEVFLERIVCLFYITFSFLRLGHPLLDSRLTHFIHPGSNDWLGGPVSCSRAVVPHHPHLLL